MTRDFTRLTEYLDANAQVQGAQARDSLHDSVAKWAFDKLCSYGPVTAKWILDVGCGTGHDLKRFQQNRMQTVGYTLSINEVSEVLKGGVFTVEQEFMSGVGFDFLWSRHCLEHSIMPAFTLTEYARVLNQNGIAYIEVPALATAQHWERHPHHFSVLSNQAWLSLMDRAGFDVLDRYEVVMTALTEDVTMVMDDFDIWSMFFLRKR